MGLLRRIRSAESSVAGLDTSDLDPGRWGTTVISFSSCSVCDRAVELGGLHPVWISLRVATDVLPLLVNACSAQCVAELPRHPRVTSSPRTQAAESANPRPTGTDAEDGPE